MTTVLRLILIISFAIALIACGGATPRDEDVGVSRGTNHGAQVNTQLGAAYLRRGQYEEALGKLNKALDYDPNYATAHTTLAILYEQIGEIDLAENHHRRATRLDPNNANAQNNFGAFLCKIGKYREAEKHFLAAAGNPFYQTPEEALANAGKCMLKIPDDDRAEQFFREALSRRPNFPDALYALAELNLRNQEHLRARAFLQRYEALQPETPETLLLGYRIERALGSEMDAELYAEKLKRQFPNTPQAAELQSP
ncbi:MAG: PilW family type IVa pilus biogenesis/stability lipoprotein TapF [Wenzhouxiangellaceae bacterium]